jgi:uncharacterized membrane protein
VSVSEVSAEPARTAHDRGLAEIVRSVRIDRRVPFGILMVLAVTWTIAMGRLIVLRHDRFGTFDFDEGIYDQFLWQLAHGRQFDTVRGVTLAGHHASIAFLLLAPLVWLGAGPNTWNVLFAAAMAGTTIPLYFLAKDKLRNSWLALLVGVVWLAQPTVQWMVQEGFHPDGMAIPFLIGTWLFGERLVAQRRARSVERGTRWAFVACFLLTITWKEDLALALLGMGLVWIIRGQWRLGSKVVVAGAAWFLIFGVWLVPRFAGGSVYGGIYGDLGHTPGQILVTSAEHPTKLAHRLDQNNAVGYSRDLSQSWAYLPWLSPVTMLIGAPQWFTNIVSSANFTYSLHFHYQSVPMAALAISFVEALRLLLRWRRWIGEGLALTALVCALACSRWYGPSPISIQYRLGAWPLVADADQGARQTAVDLVPSHAGVSADYLTVSHLTHRQIAYSFPNPWRNSNFGVKDSAHGYPAKVQWLVVNTSILGNDTALFQSILDSGEFAVRYHEGNEYLLQRVRPPGQGTRPVVVPPS